MINYLSPSIILIVSSLLIWKIPSKKIKNILVLLLPLITIIYILLLPNGSYGSFIFILNNQLTPININELNRPFALIFAFIAFIGTLYCFLQQKKLEIYSALFYCGASIGAVLAGDLITLFIYWELSTIGATLILWGQDTQKSKQAALRYLFIHLISGMLLLTGTSIHAINYSTEISNITSLLHINDISAYLILLSILIKLGVPPFSSWIADSYPAASYSGTVFLSAFTTKLAVYTIIRLFPGYTPLIYIGAFMIVYGTIYAFCHNNERKSLSYSMICQIGFILTAVGIGTPMSLNIAVLYAIMHIIYKSALFMGHGIIIYNSENEQYPNMALFKKSSLILAVVIIGALTISASPLTGTYTLKFIMSYISLQNNMSWLYIITLISISGMISRILIRFLYKVYNTTDEITYEPQKFSVPWNMKISTTILGILCIVLGIFPQLLYYFAPYKEAIFNTYHPFNFRNIITTLEIFAFSIFTYIILKNYYNIKEKYPDTILLDFDWIWRKLIFNITTLLIKIGIYTHVLFIKKIVNNLNILFENILNITSKPKVNGSGWTTVLITIIPVATLTIVILIFSYSYNITK